MEAKDLKRLVNEAAEEAIRIYRAQPQNLKNADTAVETAVAPFRSLCPEERKTVLVQVRGRLLAVMFDIKPRARAAAQS